MGDAQTYEVTSAVTWYRVLKLSAPKQNKEIANKAKT